MSQLPSLASTNSGNRPSSANSSHAQKSPSKSFNLGVVDDSNQTKEEYEAEIKSLQRDKQVLQAKLEKLEAAQNKQIKKLDNEKELRLQANRDRYWLQQKLAKLQMAIQARLKMLNVDFSNCNDLSEALDAAFAAIQKLAASRAEKEEIINKLEAEKLQLSQGSTTLSQQIDQLNKNLKDKEDIIADQSKALNDKKKELVKFDKTKNEFENEKLQYEQEIEKLKSELDDERKHNADNFNTYLEKQAQLENQLKTLQNEKNDMAKQLAKSEQGNNKLKDENDELRKKLEAMEAELAKARREMQDYKNDMQTKNDQLQATIEQMKQQIANKDAMNDDLNRQLQNSKKKVLELEDTMSIQDEEIARYKHDFELHKSKAENVQQQMLQNDEELNDELSTLKSERTQMIDLLKKLRTEREEKDEEMKNLKQQLAETMKKLNDLLSIPKEDKEVQTDIAMSYFDKVGIQLAQLEDISKQNNDLRNTIREHESRLAGLTDENKVLVDEIELLLKQAARFQPDGSNHTGELLAMVASPKNYVVATSASDRTVRLWSVNPKAEQKKQVTPYACSRMQGTALSLAFTNDGKYLVAGVAYQSGPEGALLIWNMEQGDGDVETLFRSRPTLRFGRATCVCWSNDNRYIFSGDTTGTIWVWDMERQIQLAEIQAHKDVCHDIAVSRGVLFSCSLDQTICCFDIKELAEVPVKKQNFHLHKPKKLKASILDKNEQYPYWSLSPTEDCAYIVAGGRKVYVFQFDSNKKQIDKGPNVSDTDLDHVKALVVRNGMICVCRQNTPRAKIFDVTNGKELKKIQFKTPVSRIVFTYDVNNVVVACQAIENKVAQPPNLRLWAFNEQQNDNNKQ